MPLTLEQAKATMHDKVEQLVIDEFRRSSLLLDQMTFDDAVAPGTGGSTLVYGYTRLKTPSTAGSRAINEEYQPNQALREKATTELKIFGGAFEVDRVLQDTSGNLNEIQFQLQQKILGARNYFHYQVINGDDAADPETFDGLDKMLTGSSTEINTGSVVDISDVMSQSEAFALLDTVDAFLGELSGRPSMLAGNSKMIQRIKSAARSAGYLSAREDAFGQTVDAYDNIPLVDLGHYYNGSVTVPVVPIVTRTVNGVQTSGLTDLYAVSLGLDGFHGVTPQGGVGLRTYLPNLSEPGAVKKGEVEMVAGVALKQTRKAAVLRNLKVQATSTS